MKKQIIYLATLAALTTGGVAITNQINPSLIGSSVAHAGTAGFNINSYVDNHRWTFDIVYWDDASQSYKTDVLGSYNDLANDINNARARDEDNPQNNTGFNVDANGTYWYRNYNSSDTQSDVQSELNEFRYFILPNGNKVDATDDSTTSQVPGVNNQASTSSSNDTSSNQNNNNQTNSNQKQIKKETKLLDQSKKELKHANGKHAKKEIRKQITNLKAQLKTLKNQ